MKREAARGRRKRQMNRTKWKGKKKGEKYGRVKKKGEERSSGIKIRGKKRRNEG